MLTCSKCRQRLPPEDFYRDRRAKTGRHPKCKRCDKAYADSMRPHLNSYMHDRYHRDSGVRARQIAAALQWQREHPKEVAVIRHNYWLRCKAARAKAKAEAQPQ